MDVLPFVEIFEGLLSYVFESVEKESEVVL
jgi:hypothetical protein